MLKGILTKEDYYEDEEVGSLVGNLLKSIELPPEIQHYSLMNPPVNTLVGEQSRRPDQARVKAVDEDSKAEQLEFRNNLIKQLVLQKAREKIMQRAGMEGQELDEEQVQQLTVEEVQQEMVSYTSKAEKWANKLLNSCKLEFNIKELSEEGMRDLLITSSEYYHVYEDGSKTGFSVEVLNPKNVWNLSTPNKKYTSDVAGVGKGAYASGVIDVMEMSQILERFPLTKKEVDHLRDQVKETGLPSAKSNYGTTASGPNTINYTTYSPVELQEQMIAESEALEGAATTTKVRRKRSTKV